MMIEGFPDKGTYRANGIFNFLLLRPVILENTLGAKSALSRPDSDMPASC